MIDKLTLADLLRITVWAFSSALPLYLAGAAAIVKNDKDGVAILVWLMLLSQFAFGLAAYIAGGK